MSFRKVPKKGREHAIAFLVKNIPERKNSKCKCCRSWSREAGVVWCGENGNEIGGREDHIGPYFVIRILAFTLGDGKPLEGFEQRSSMNRIL